MKSAQSPCRILERVEQGDEEADALEVGATGDALVGAVDAAVAFVIVDHKGGEADALVANALVVGGFGCTNHGRGHDAHRLLTHRRRSGVFTDFGTPCLSFKAKYQGQIYAPSSNLLQA